MSIHHVQILSNSKALSTDFNKVSDDACNTIDNIHPQYFHHYDALGFEVKVIKLLGVQYRQKLNRGYRQVEDEDSTSALKRITFKKLPDFVHTNLRIKFKIKKVENSSSINSFAAFAYVYAGNNTTPIHPVPPTGGYTLTTLEQAIDITVDISSLTANSIITIDLIVSNSIYSAPIDNDDYESGQIYDIEIYTA